MSSHSEEEKKKVFSFEQVQKALARLVWDDESLRHEIMRDPKKVIERELHILIPENLKVKVIDQAEPNTVYFVLTPNPMDALGFELSAEQLDQIAGSATEQTIEEFQSPELGTFFQNIENLFPKHPKPHQHNF